MILMGIVYLPSLCDYWKKDSIFHYSPIADKITRDQMRGYYHVRLKCKKYCKYIFWFLFDVAISNTYFLARAHCGLKSSLKDTRASSCTTSDIYRTKQNTLTILYLFMQDDVYTRYSVHNIFTAYIQRT